MKWITSLLLLMTLPVLAQVPQLPPSPPPYITNMVFTTNEGVTSSFDFPLRPPFTNAPVVIHSPKHLEMLSSLGRPMKRATTTTQAKQMLMGGKQPALVQPQLITLAWYYPPDLVTGVVFEVYHATYLNSFPVLTNAFQIPSGFTLLLEVTGGTNCLVQPYQAQEFFIVRARDVATGQHSTWNVVTAVTGPLERVVMVTPTDGEVVSNTITLQARVITLDPPFTLTMR